MPIVITWIISNWQLIVKGIGAVIIVFACWFYFIHNPKVIKDLEEDKAELARMLKAKNAQITLFGDIEKGKVVINDSVRIAIQELRSTARPRRSIIIRSGVPLPSLPTVKAAH